MTVLSEPPNGEGITMTDRMTEYVPSASPPSPISRHVTGGAAVGVLGHRPLIAKITLITSNDG